VPETWTIQRVLPQVPNGPQWLRSEGRRVKEESGDTGVRYVWVADLIWSISISTKEVCPGPARIWIHDGEGRTGFPDLNEVYRPPLRDTTLDSVQRLTEGKFIVSGCYYAVAQVECFRSGPEGDKWPALIDTSNGFGCIFLFYYCLRR